MSAYRKLRQRLVIYALVFPVGVMPLHAQAGLKEAMNDIFISTSTNPQAIATQRLNGVYGGTMTLRPIGKAINIVQFAAPRIDAGCGGIDIFFGSFSFINGDQFEQLLRSIASAAVGYAVKAAINWMCNPCGAIIEALETTMRELNAMAKNTCAIGKQLAQMPPSTALLQEHASKIGASISTAYNKTADSLAAENNRQAETPSKSAKGGDDTSKEDNPHIGNIVYRAADKTFSNGANSLGTFVGKKAAIELVMALYGTKIISPAALELDGAAAAGATCKSGTSPERCDDSGEWVAPRIASLQEFVMPGDSGLAINSCANAACTKLTSAVISKAEWGGVKEVVHMAMYGVINPSGYQDYTSDSLAGYFTNQGGTLSIKANALATVAPLPIIRYLREVQKNPMAVQMIANLIADGLVPFIKYQLAVEMQKTAMNAFTQQKETTMPIEFSGYIDLRSLELNTLNPPPGEMARYVNSINQAVLSVQYLIDQKTIVR